jgi:hypothetical protein
MEQIDIEQIAMIFLDGQWFIHAICGILLLSTRFFSTHSALEWFGLGVIFLIVAFGNSITIELLFFSPKINNGPLSLKMALKGSVIFSTIVYGAIGANLISHALTTRHTKGPDSSIDPCNRREKC